MTSKSNGGIGIAGTLTIIFIVLKLVGVIDWSWWWVLSPLWIGFAITLLIFLALGFILLLINIRDKIK